MENSTNAVVTTVSIEVAMKKVAQSVLKKLDKPRTELSGIVAKIGKVGTDGLDYPLTAPNCTVVVGYNKVRSAINEITNIFYDEKCFVIIDGVKLEFLGGKFSNSLLKVLELATKEFTNNGNMLVEHEDFKSNFDKIKEGFLPNISIADLLPAVVAVSKLGKKEIAFVSKAIADQNNFRQLLLIEVNNEIEATK